MMTSDFYNDTLCELRSEIESLKQLNSTRNLMRNQLIQKNNTNEAISRKLVSQKKELEFIKDVLLRDYHKHEIGAGKNKILMSNQLKQYCNRCESVKLKSQNLPYHLQLSELSVTNDKLNAEFVTLSESLKNMTKEYAQLCLTVRCDFTNKVIEFCNEYLNMVKNDKLKFEKIKKNGCTMQD